MPVSAGKESTFKVKEHTITYWYAPPSFNVSSFILDGIEYFSQSKFRPGAFGMTDLFANKNQEYMIVKTPLEPIENLKYLRDQYQKEIQLIEEANPNEGVYALDIRPLESLGESKSESMSGFFAYAMFMPYFPEMDLDEAMRQVTSREQVITYLLATAMEIERVHHLEISHNDIRGNNIRFDTKNNKARLIDYYRASALNKKEETDLPATEVGIFENYVAPELRREAAGPHIATPASDMYSFGMMLKFFLVHATSWISDKEKSTFTSQTSLYPSFIWRFQDAAHSGDPTRRPSFESFIQTLQTLATQPLNLSIQYIFSTKNPKSSNFTLQLKVDDKLYSPAERYKGSSNSQIEIYHTAKGKFRVKFHTAHEHRFEVLNAMAYSNVLFPESLEDLNRSYAIYTHPLCPSQCQYTLFSITRHRERLAFDQYLPTFKQLSELQQLRCLLAICRTLHSIHTRGYVIGNLKMQHLIIDDQTKDGIPKIAIYDLNWTHRLDYPYAKTANCDPQIAHWHPDRKKRQLIKPLPCHDTFALAYVFIGMDPKLIKDTKTKVIITQFCNDASLNPPGELGKSLQPMITLLAAEEQRLVTSATPTTNTATQKTSSDTSSSSTSSNQNISIPKL